ncbi:MAG TPA: hypothetical protein VEU96_01545 [Bryobacteraceae bacterium]|nr:hypothetical protein [Bryobacteraceae bacterium]
MPLRQRQKVQKMPRRLKTGDSPHVSTETGDSPHVSYQTSFPFNVLLNRKHAGCPRFPRFLILALCLAPAFAANLPDQLGSFHRISSEPIEITANRPIWDEYGLETAERANYGAFRLAAWQMKDPTGAFAAAQWLKPSDPAVTTLGNYVLSCSGKCPPAARLKDLLGNLPKLSHSSYPNLDTHLPAKDQLPASKRYILGPASLAEFEPRIPPAAVAFDFSSEAQLAKYRTTKGEATMALFSYPTPQIARQQAAALAKLPDAAVKRAGPIVALVIAPANQAAADSLLAQIDYKASVSSDDQPLPLVLTPTSAGQMILAICTLAGIVLAFCLLSGLVFGGARIVARKFGYSDAQNAMTTLHLSDKITPPVSPR